MSTLPPPPAPPIGAVADDGPPRPPPRAGQLTSAWRVVFVVGWIGVLLGFGAISKSSLTLGLSTWWLGASSDRQLLVIQMLPFVPGAALVVLAARNIRFLPWFGAAGALTLAAIATGDVGRFNGLALAEYIVSAAALLLSLSTLAGVMQTADSAAEPVE